MNNEITNEKIEKALVEFLKLYKSYEVTSIEGVHTIVSHEATLHLNDESFELFNELKNGK